MIVTAAICVAAAGLGAAVAGPLGGALRPGRRSSRRTGKHVDRQYAEQFGAKSAEKLLDSGADSLVERFRRPGTSLDGVYRAIVAKTRESAGSPALGRMANIRSPAQTMCR